MAGATRVLIFAPMPSEMRPVVKLLGLQRSGDQGRLPIYTGRRADVDVVLTGTGIGPALARAAASLISPRTRINGRVKRSPLIGKLRTARCVEAPYQASAGTSIGPIESRSVRVSGITLHQGVSAARHHTAGQPDVTTVTACPAADA